jgi:hypothetical protein
MCADGKSAYRKPADNRPRDALELYEEYLRRFHERMGMKEDNSGGNK